MKKIFLLIIFSASSLFTSEEPGPKRQKTAEEQLADQWAHVHVIHEKNPFYEALSSIKRMDLESFAEYISQLDHIDELNSLLNDVVNKEKYFSPYPAWAQHATDAFAPVYENQETIQAGGTMAYLFKNITPLDVEADEKLLLVLLEPYYEQFKQVIQNQIAHVNWLAQLEQETKSHAERERTSI